MWGKHTAPPVTLPASVREPFGERGKSLGGPPAGFWGAELGRGGGDCRSSLSGKGLGKDVRASQAAGLSRARWEAPALLPPQCCPLPTPTIPLLPPAEPRSHRCPNRSGQSAAAARSLAEPRPPAAGNPHTRRREAETAAGDTGKTKRGSSSPGSGLSHPNAPRTPNLSLTTGLSLERVGRDCPLPSLCPPHPAPCWLPPRHNSPEHSAASPRAREAEPDNTGEGSCGGSSTGRRAGSCPTPLGSLSAGRAGACPAVARGRGHRTPNGVSQGPGLAR